MRHEYEIYKAEMEAVEDHLKLSFKDIEEKESKTLTMKREMEEAKSELGEMKVTGVEAVFP